jgi:hypothetical protein
LSCFTWFIAGYFNFGVYSAFRCPVFGLSALPKKGFEGNPFDLGLVPSQGFLALLDRDLPVSCVVPVFCYRRKMALSTKKSFLRDRPRTSFG